ncbi:TadE/TadG family type IV pilus assembly protein [Nocardioides sp.]|uniref:TadE/TadG family type IV pilus assembly protein n=1 Tax=Nocardioides sp. TaxID=35761 RepID=UPI002D1266D5|nr:TadE/TadG family type IV pilus assembly protein [Nocardioides sp.]HXH81285.1 TadE/TadG family type IV pilus assembly protein [Nocardioides sp.]
MFRSSRARSDERGAAAVEFALIAMPLILLLFMIVEASLLMKDYVSVSSAVRTGARTASASADGGPGTCQASANPPPCTPAGAPAFAQAAADSIQTTGNALNNEDIDWVLIYKPGANGYPSGQSTLTCGSNCVKYVWDAGLSKFRYSSGSWASASVNACLNDPLRDSVGVGMQVTHTMVSGFFGSTKTVQDRTVMQFEPLEQDRCKPGTPNAHS